MTWENIIPVVIALLGSGIIVAWMNRRKTSAETNQLIVQQAATLVDELQEERKAGREERDELRRERNELRQQLREFQQTTAKEIEQLKAELKVQESALDDLQVKNLKYQFVLSAFANQLRLAGFEPVIDPADIDTMKLDDIQVIADGMSRVETRRRQKPDD